MFINWDEKFPIYFKVHSYQQLSSPGITLVSSAQQKKRSQISVPHWEGEKRRIVQLHFEIIIAFLLVIEVQMTQRRRREKLISWNDFLFLLRDENSSSKKQPRKKKSHKYLSRTVIAEVESLIRFKQQKISSEINVFMNSRFRCFQSEMKRKKKKQKMSIQQLKQFLFFGFHLFFAHSRRRSTCRFLSF